MAGSLVDQGHAGGVSDLKSGTNVRRAILVAGMHRSGTSAATRVLSILGCTLPANLLPPSKGDNDRGFWESKRVMDINNEMLESAGSYWDDWNFIREEWFSSPVARSYTARAVDVLAEETGEAPLIVVKDPRICRLLPVWTEAVEALGYTPSILQPIRNPIEVAQSLMKRSHIDVSIGQLVWLRHVLDAEYYSRPHARSFVHYETLMTDWRAWVAQTERDLELGFPRLSPVADEEIGEFLEPGLWRNRVPDALLKDAGNAPAWVRDTYAVLRNWTNGKKTAKDEGVLNRVRAELQDVTPAFLRPLHSYRKTRKAYEDLTRDSDKLRNEFGVKSDALAHAENETEALREKLKAQADELQAVQKDFAAAKSEYSETKTALKESLDKAVAEAAREKQARVTAESRWSELTTAKEELTGTLNKIRAERDKLKAELDKALGAKAEAETALKASLAKAEANGADLAGKNAELEASLKQATDDLEATRQASATFEIKYTELDKSLKALQADRDESEKALNGALNQAAEEARSLQSALSDAEARSSKLAEANGALEAELKALRADKESAVAALADALEQVEAQKSAHTAEATRREEIEHKFAEQAAKWSESEQVLTASLKEALAGLSAAQEGLAAETAARTHAEEKIRSLTDRHAANEAVLKESLREALARFSQTREALVTEEAGRTELAQMLERLRKEQQTAEKALQSALEDATRELAHSREAVKAGEAAQRKLEEQVRTLQAEQAATSKALSVEAERARAAQAQIENLGRQLENEARRRKSTEEARFRESAVLTRLAAQKDDEGARLRDIVLKFLRALSATEKAVSLRTLLVPSRRKQAEINLRRDILVASGGFDPDWYLAQNPDVAASGMDAAEHYMVFGINEGRVPHPMFDRAE